MAVRVYDTLRRRAVDLTVRDPDRVAMYVCGPTVYDVPHVGHGRFAVAFDMIRRYLAWRGFAVHYVSNVTDVDDRIIARAQRAGRSEPEVAQEFEAAYWCQMDRLAVLRPDDIPHATQYIEPMLELIGDLVASDHAYVLEGSGVYFDVGTFPTYGELAHRSLEQLRESAGARVEVDDAKRSPLDFALWKAAKPGEPAWDSPWGRGRPGWHIECSAMSLDLLGDSFDLHGGGGDLVFPHHENERAQAEAAGHAFARHWIHSGMVEIGGAKMSKSLGNFTTLSDALDAHGPRAFRLAVAQTHYRSDIELGDAELAQAAEAVRGLDALTRRSHAAGVRAGADLDEATVARFRAAMDDDFSTPEATAALFAAARAANRAVDAGSLDAAASLLGTVRELSACIGLDALDAGVDERDIRGGSGDGDDIGAAVAARDAARRSGDFATADRIRDELSARGITLEDTPDGTIWHRD